MTRNFYIIVLSTTSFIVRNNFGERNEKFKGINVVLFPFLLYLPLLKKKMTKS